MSSENERPIPRITGARQLDRFNQPTGDLDRGHATISDLYADLSKLTQEINEKVFSNGVEMYSDRELESGRETRDFWQRLQWLLGPQPKTWTDQTRDFLSKDYARLINIGIKLLKYIDTHPQHEAQRDHVLRTVRQIVLDTDSVLCLARHAGYMRNGSLYLRRDNKTAAWAEAVTYPESGYDPDKPDINLYIKKNYAETLDSWKLLMTSRATRFYDSAFGQEDKQVIALSFQLIRMINLSNLIQAEKLQREEALDPTFYSMQAAQLILDRLLGETLSSPTYQKRWQSQHDSGFELQLDPDNKAPLLAEYTNYLAMSLTDERTPYLMNLTTDGEIEWKKLIDNLLCWHCLKTTQNKQILGLGAFVAFDLVVKQTIKNLKLSGRIYQELERQMSAASVGKTTFDELDSI